MNSAESAALVLVCRERGWEVAPNGESADLVLINTCSVRLTAEQRALGRIALYASLKKKRLAQGQQFALVVAGCMAQRMEKTLKKQFPAVDYVMGTVLYIAVLSFLVLGVKNLIAYLIAQGKRY